MSMANRALDTIMLLDGMTLTQVAVPSFETIALRTSKMWPGIPQSCREVVLTNRRDDCNDPSWSPAADYERNNIARQREPLTDTHVVRHVGF